MGGVHMLDTLKDFNDTLNQFDVCIMYFTAAWCGPCKKVTPLYEKLSQDDTFKNVGFFKIDVDVNEKTTEQQNVECMPTFQIFKKNEHNKSELVHEVKGANIAEVTNSLVILV